jgi:hypothetical protein
MTREKLSARLDKSPLRSLVSLVETVQAPTLPADIDFAHDIFEHAESVVSRMEQLEPNQSAERTGGIMVVARGGAFPFVAIREIAQIKTDKKRTSAEKRKKYTIFALAKAAILLGNPELTSSGQNLNLSTNDMVIHFDEQRNLTVVPAGAMRIGEYIVSFSSFLPQDDEAVVLGSAELAQSASPDDIQSLANKLGNQRYSKDVRYPLVLKEPELTTEELNKYRQGRVFGDNLFVNDLLYQLLEAKDYLGLSIALGWSEACDVIPRVIKGRGTKETAESYAELKLTRGILLESVRRQYPQITAAFTRPIKRRQGEPNTGGYPAMNDGHQDTIPANEKLLSYDLPRLFRAFWGQGDRKSRDPKRFFEGMDVVDRALKEANKHGWNATEFIVHLAGRFADIDQNAPKYIRRLLSAGKYKDDNQQYAHRKLVRTMRSMHSPLWSAYKALSSEARSKLSIADIRI